MKGTNKSGRRRASEPQIQTLKDMHINPYPRMQRGVADKLIKANHDTWSRLPPQPRQISFLLARGIDPAGMNRGEARTAISVIKKQPGLPASFEEVEALKAAQKTLKQKGHRQKSYPPENEAISPPKGKRGRPRKKLDAVVNEAVAPTSLTDAGDTPNSYAKKANKNDAGKATPVRFGKTKLPRGKGRKA